MKITFDLPDGAIYFAYVCSHEEQDGSVTYTHSAVSKKDMLHDGLHITVPNYEPKDEPTDCAWGEA